MGFDSVQFAMRCSRLAPGRRAHERQTRTGGTRVTINIRLGAALVGALGMALATASLAWASPKDLVLVVDNSGSMKQNDPGFLTRDAVSSFLRALPAGDRAALLIFDESSRLEVPLTAVSDSDPGAFDAAIAKINFRGQFTNSPDAIERAIYELSFRGREDAERAIIFITDGIVDTGNPEADRDKARWLRESLSADARTAGIRIFGVAFTENADFHLIQTMARETEGSYYRVLTAADIEPVFDRIRSELATENVVEAPPPTSRLIEPAVPDELDDLDLPGIDDWSDDESVLTQADLDRRARSEAPREIRQEAPKSRSGVWLWALLLLVLVTGAGFAALFLWRRRTGSPASESSNAAPIPQPVRAQVRPGAVPAGTAFLRDLEGITGTDSFDISNGISVVGRVASSDTKDIQYIVIEDPAISRRHAVIEMINFSYWITDQGSSNGTTVNGIRIHDKTQLKQGDVVNFHAHEFEFTMPDLENADVTRVLAPDMAAEALIATAKMDAAEVARIMDQDREPSTDPGAPDPDVENIDLDEFMAVSETIDPAAATPDLEATMARDSEQIRQMMENERDTATIDPEVRATDPGKAPESTREPVDLGATMAGDARDIARMAADRSAAVPGSPQPELHSGQPPGTPEEPVDLGATLTANAAELRSPTELGSTGAPATEEPSSEEPRPPPKSTQDDDDDPDGMDETKIR